MQRVSNQPPNRQYISLTLPFFVPRSRPHPPSLSMNRTWQKLENWSKKEGFRIRGRKFQSWKSRVTRLYTALWTSRCSAGDKICSDENDEGERGGAEEEEEEGRKRWKRGNKGGGGEAASFPIPFVPYMVRGWWKNVGRWPSMRNTAVNLHDVIEMMGPCNGGGGRCGGGGRGGN